MTGQEIFVNLSPAFKTLAIAHLNDEDRYPICLVHTYECMYDRQQFVLFKIDLSETG